MNFIYLLIDFFIFFKKKGLSHKAKREEMQTAMNRPQDPNPPLQPPRLAAEGGSCYNQIKGAIQQDSHCSDCVYLH